MEALEKISTQCIILIGHGYSPFCIEVCNIIGVRYKCIVLYGIIVFHNVCHMTFMFFDVVECEMCAVYSYSKDVSKYYVMYVCGY